MRAPRKFWHWAVVQAVIVMIVLAWRFYVGVSAYLAHPTDGDMYAHNWSFQAIACCVVGGPIVVIGMAGLLGSEWLVVRAIKKLAER
jgi:hypothetical protein